MKKGFTLSEVLITLAIIGVVSALTVPTLVNNYQHEAQAVQLRKQVAEIAQAVDMYITEEGKSSLAATSAFKDENGLEEFFKSKFKVVSESGFNSSYKSQFGKDTNFTCNGKTYKLANSAVVCVAKKNTSLNFYIDTNGIDAPNVGGRDMFAFSIDKTGTPQAFVTGNTQSLQDEIYNDNSDVAKCKRDAFGSECYPLLVKNNYDMEKAYSSSYADQGLKETQKNSSATEGFGESGSGNSGSSSSSSSETEKSSASEFSSIKGTGTSDKNSSFEEMKTRP